MSRQLLEAIQWSVPSALTLGAMLSGLTSVRLASENEFDWSLICVIAAAILDGLDGHVARYLGTVSEIGFELDSLCDLANFGVSPALIVYFWARTLPAHDCRSHQCWLDNAALWAACCVYAGCCAFRLARFNVLGHKEQMDSQYIHHERPPVKTAFLHNFRRRKLYFQGVPAPVGAAYALSPMMFGYSALSDTTGLVAGVGSWVIGRTSTACVLLTTAALMVSPLPTLSSKMLKISREDSHLHSRHMASLVVKIVSGCAFCACLWRFPFDVMLLLDLAHLLSIPLGVIMFHSFALDDDKET